MRRSPLARRQARVSEPTGHLDLPIVEPSYPVCGDERSPSHVGRVGSKGFEDPVSIGVLNEDEGRRLFDMQVDLMRDTQVSSADDSALCDNVSLPYHSLILKRIHGTGELPL